jgi:hypothetical protein
MNNNSNGQLNYTYFELLLLLLLFEFILLVLISEIIFLDS